MQWVIMMSMEQGINVEAKVGTPDIAVTGCRNYGIRWKRLLMVPVRIMRIIVDASLVQKLVVNIM